MNKTTKWLVGPVAALAMVNIALVATLWLKKEKAVEPPQRRGDAREYLIKELQLDKAQQAAFDSLRKEHFEKIAQYKTAMRFLKDRLFGLLSEKDTNRIKGQITGYIQDKIGEVQANIDLETFYHFYRLRSTLSTEQKQKFDSTIQNVLRTLDPRANHPEGFPPPGAPPGERQGPPPEDRDGMRPPPPGGAPPPY